MTASGNTSLDRLIELARSIDMTEAQREAQRRSFVYGNTKIENDRITRELVDEQADLLAKAAE
jgi:hypothetical protein